MWQSPVYCNSLENCRVERLREFESHRFRQVMLSVVATMEHRKTCQCRPMQGPAMKSRATVDSSAAESTFYGVVAQLVSALACHAGGRGFESRPLRQQCISNVMAA